MESLFKVSITISSLCFTRAVLMLFLNAQRLLAILILGYWITNDLKQKWFKWNFFSFCVHFFFHCYLKPVLALIYSCKFWPCTLSSQAKVTEELLVLFIVCELFCLITWGTDVSETQKTVGFNSCILESLENMGMDVTEQEDSVILVVDLFQVCSFCFVF